MKGLCHVHISGCGFQSQPLPIGLPPVHNISIRYAHLHCLPFKEIKQVLDSLGNSWVLRSGRGKDGSKEILHIGLEHHLQQTGKGAR